jgi:spermidine synthase
MIRVVIVQTILAIFVACGASPLSAVASGGRTAHAPAVVELDQRSGYSHIRVTRQGNVRTLLFVHDNGEEVVESMINLKRPHELLLPYSRFMFASYLIQPNQQRVLIVGLGGGGMVHFYQHYEPEVNVDAVEIDPAVVEIAEKYFHTRSGAHTRIITQDAFRYFEKTKLRYDVIYMDAFLKPSRQTDSAGTPRRMKTAQFYKALGEKLAPRGLVAFNLNVSSDLQDDVNTIRAAFRQCYVFRAHKTNVVVIGCGEESRQSLAALHEQAREQDRRFHATFSFQELLNHLDR